MNAQYSSRDQLTAIMGKREKAILQATLELVAEQGLTGLSISQISARAEAGPGVIYHYFAAKDDIIHAVFQAINQEYSAFLLAHFPSEANWQEQIKYVWLRSYEFFQDNPKKTRFHEQYKNSPYYDLESDLEGDPLFAPIIGPFLAERAKGHVKNLPFPILYAMTMGVMMNIVKMHIEGAIAPDQATLAAIAKACCQSITV